MNRPRLGAPDAPQERAAETVAKEFAPEASHASNPTTPKHDQAVPSMVSDTLRQPGQALDSATRALFEPALDHDFSSVRIHTGDTAAASARSIQARAYTAGDDIVFAKGQYNPSTIEGRGLLAHELAHVAQGNASVRRRIEIRDVGRGEQSGFARVPELIDRLNAVANGLVFRLDENNNLAYVENPYGTMTEFERRMKGFIDAGVIRLRITNHSGLVGTRATGFTQTVDVDDFQSGYVDIDDLLSADEVAFQTLMVHFLTERSVTRDYTRRLGTEFSPDEFDRGHDAGIDAETQVLRDFFQDPTIRFVNEPAISTGIARVWTNRRRDTIRAPFRRSGGVETWSIQVRLRDGRTMTATQYRDFLANAAAGANQNP